MSTGIQWCDETINPIIGCKKISEGCRHCYAETMANRLAAMGNKNYLQVIGYPNGWNHRSTFVPEMLEKPYKWKKPRSIFVVSMGDLFHESVWRCWIDDVMRMVANNSQHTFIFLTKRPERMRQYFDLCDRDLVGELTAFYQLSHGTDPYNLAANWPLPNLVLGVSVENQQTADERIPTMLQTPAVKRFISLEPMIGPVDLVRSGAIEHDSVGDPTPGVGGSFSRANIDGVILGGENSANGARYLNSTWVKSIRDQCEAAEVPFMFKQGSGNNGDHWHEQDADGWPLLDGRAHKDLAWEVR